MNNRYSLSSPGKINVVTLNKIWLATYKSYLPRRYSEWFEFANNWPNTKWVSPSG